MKSIVITLALVMGSMAAQANFTLNNSSIDESCNIPILEQQVEAYINVKMNDGGTRFIGACLEKAIQDTFEAETIRGVKVDRNLLSEEMVVLDIKRELDHAREAAEVKAEVFEKSFSVSESELREYNYTPLGAEPLIRK